MSSPRSRVYGGTVGLEPVIEPVEPDCRRFEVERTGGGKRARRLADGGRPSRRRIPGCASGDGGLGTGRVEDPSGEDLQTPGEVADLIAGREDDGVAVASDVQRMANARARCSAGPRRRRPRSRSSSSWSRTSRATSAGSVSGWWTARRRGWWTALTRMPSDAPHHSPRSTDMTTSPLVTAISPVLMLPRGSGHDAGRRASGRARPGRSAELASHLVVRDRFAVDETPHVSHRRAEVLGGSLHIDQAPPIPHVASIARRTADLRSHAHRSFQPLESLHSSTGPSGAETRQRSP